MSNNSRRKMPTEKAIREYWADELWKVKGFDSREEFLEPGNCFACGGHAGAVEKAHILAKCEGGSEDASNLHMLCDICHKDSEGLSGDHYMLWLKQRTNMDQWYSSAARSGLNIYTELESFRNYSTNTVRTELCL